MQELQELQEIWARLDAQHFGSALPACRIEWSRRLTRAAGNIDVRQRLVKLSVPLLIDAFADGRSHTVVGIACHSSEQAIEEILKHEMIHLWLFERGLPSGHTPAFRAKAREIGQPKTRHEIARPLPKSGWIYSCPKCGAQFARRKRFGRARACAACCKAWNNGAFDKRFVLKGRRIG